MPRQDRFTGRHLISRVDVHQANNAARRLTERYCQLSEILVERNQNRRFAPGRLFPQSNMAAIVWFALATGCRASEITGLEWSRVDLERKTAWLNRTKNGTPRGVPLNRDAVAVLVGQRGKHPQYCFSFRKQPIRWEVCNTAWLEAVKRAGLTDFRFHDTGILGRHGIGRPKHRSTN